MISSRYLTHIERLSFFHYRVHTRDRIVILYFRESLSQKSHLKTAKSCALLQTGNKCWARMFHDPMNRPMVTQW